MAASDARKTEAVQPATDGKWVFVHSAGDAEKEELLEEQDGDVIGEKENTPNAAEGQESAQDTDKYLWWLRSGWNDVSVRNALWDDMRPYVLIAALFVYAVLQVLVALASLAQCNAPHALFISLKHFASATLNAAVLSLVTRCASLTVAKASTVKKALHPRLSDTGDSVFLIILVACFACVYEIGGGIKVFQESRREEDFQWFLQLLADMARVHVLTAAIVLTSSLVFLMETDLAATSRATVMHVRMMAQYRKRPARRSPERRATQGPPLYLTIAVMVVGFLVVVVVFLDILVPTYSRPYACQGPTDSAASGGI